MKVEPSGVIFLDVCTIQTEKCAAKAPASITAVWTLPGRVQVNVCRPCLEEQVRRGEWEIEGARIRKRYDVAVYSPDNKLQLIVEVKKSPAHKNAKHWATLIHRNLLAHSGISNAPYFLLAVLPDYLFLWKRSDSANYERAPDYELNAAEILDRYAKKLSFSGGVANEHYYLEELVTRWLEDLVASDPSPTDTSFNWLYESGLYKAIQGGSVLAQATVAA